MVRFTAIVLALVAASSTSSASAASQQVRTGKKYLRYEPLRFLQATVAAANQCQCFGDRPSRKLLGNVQGQEIGRASCRERV